MTDADTLDPLQDKLRHLLERLDASFLERRAQVRLTLLALLSGHHVLLLGPPGTAKSLLARAVCQCVQGTTYFEYLLSRFTHPDELFGPVSIPGLKQEDYRRLTTGYLPQAHVAFLDEIFKANSAILNALLTLINERVFHHGTHRDPAPLQGVIGASNELPDPEGGLGALYDRFLVRMSVPPLASEDNFLSVCLGEVAPFEVDPAQRLTLDELREVRRRARAEVQADERVRDALLGIRDALTEAGVLASDRRWRWAVELVKVAAWTSGRRAIETTDLLVLEHCFGCPGDTDSEVRQAVRAHARPIVDVEAWTGPLQSKWDAVSAAPTHAPTLGGAVAMRRTALDTFSAACDAAEADMERHRDGLLAALRGSLWTNDPPPEAFAAFVGARRDVQHFRSAERAWRAQLDDLRLDLHAALSAWRPDRRASYTPFYDDDCGALLWVSLRDDAPERWLPLEDEGTVARDPARVKRLQASVRRPHPSTLPTGAARPEWHQCVLRVVLDDDELYLLATGGAAPADVAKAALDRAWSAQIDAQPDDAPPLLMSPPPRALSLRALEKLCALIQRLAPDLLPRPDAQPLERDAP